ncbi:MULTISPECIES: pirin family protein [Cyanophyceae]|uniref:pirin family protein n=1 Tax=Cyanophyceae TaxID=3028117 RepID=UPI001684BE98|nr:MULTISPECIES: pirin family protein [Cyanophyceae]MBD1917364.1 pirin family protein [Phormidium sp. FACHB-77]MBD2032288.1 pirin family protein [Phormidium sp. FACHB-322]MBD2053325.1 pirin family protein [Leptolyngbya sp. FACHB-60]
MPTLNQPSTAKTLHSIQRTQSRHWVGDGFPVRTLMAYNGLGQTISPFLLLDYAGPANFSPTTARRGVGEHPHRGFETVTIVYDGEVEHRDSAGGGGIIGPGDVQWMTAAAGLVHEEFHGPNFAKHGGPFEMVQLWVNLPAKDKMSTPRYQGITADRIPTVELPDGRGSLRVIAGEFQGAKGPAQTFTPIHLWDLRLAEGKQISLDLPEGYTTILVVLKGAIGIGGSEPIAEAEIGICNPAGTTLTLDSQQDTTALLLCGQPIDEPIVGHGPFVMNTSAEIYQAVTDYQSGKMGALTPQ